MRSTFIPEGRDGIHPRLGERALVLGIIFVSAAFGSGVQVRFDPSSLEVGPFPTDALTVTDWAQKTGRRINLPVPDCGERRSACETAKFLNEYDGFNPNPRLRVSFSAPVELESLRRGVFLMALENMTAEESGTHYNGTPIPINQLIWDPKTNSLFAKPDNVLDQHRRYALVVTGAVRDLKGDPVEPDPAFVQCVTQPNSAYCGDLADHVSVMFALGGWLGATHRIVSASIFTTLSATAWLEKARDLLPLTPPAVRTTAQRSAFPSGDIASIVFRQHTGVNPNSFTNSPLAIRSAGIRTLAFGSYQSPDYRTTVRDNFLWGGSCPASGCRWKMFPSLPTGASLPPASRTEAVRFQVTLPDAPKPAGGYPVVIFVHGGGSIKYAVLTNGLAQTAAQEGYATIAINAPGHGFGAEGALVITDRNGTVTEIPAGGRSEDLSGDGAIGGTEGCFELWRDCTRHMALDMMQLVRAIQAGIDADGDGAADLDPGGIFLHNAAGGWFGTLLLALEPGVSSGVLTAGGGSITDLQRWSPVNALGLFRFLAGLRTPPVPPNSGSGWNDDDVLRDQPVKTPQLSGALELQDVVEWTNWIAAPGDLLNYAAHLRASTLPGVPIKRVLFQISRGDQNVPNPTNSALIRAARSPEWTVLYRHDLARAAFPELPANGGAMLNLGTSGAAGAVTLATQRQALDFFSSGRRCSLLDPCIPDVSAILVPVFGKNLFEIPRTLPEDLGFLQP